jgi:molybdate transport system regulatory protein
MNRSFQQPLVSTLAGGKHGGGAQLSEQVLLRYRTLCAHALSCDALAARLAADTAAER